MFNWFKKKPSAEEQLRASLAKKVAKYQEQLEAEAEDTTDSTWTDVEIDGVVIRVPKFTPKAVEQLNESVFQEKVQVVGLDKGAHRVDQNIDPWGNAPDSTKWLKEQKHKG